MFVTRYKPYIGTGETRRGFELFNDLINKIDGAKESTAVASFVPFVNTRENEFSYHIEIDLPGIPKEDIEISTEDNVLTVSGERKLKESNKQKDYYKVESIYGKFSRNFTLPEKIDISSIQAEYNDGVLEITIPKLKDEEKQPKKIEIK